MVLSAGATRRSGQPKGRAPATGEPTVKTYREGEPFPGRIGRTWDVSEPAFPMPPAPRKGAPNVLYVILDDVGFGWTSTFGGLIETPNITRLADNGLKYTNFHTTALCSPTRACLLTGRNHHSVGMANITELASGYPGYNGRQPQDKAAIAAMLHQSGYTSFAIGKWHNTASEETSVAGPYDRWPNGPVFGFDRFYGFFGGDNNQWYPKLYLDRQPIDQPRLPEEGYHLSEDLVDRTMSCISEYSSLEPDKPWLCFLAFGACHSPHHVSKEWADKYKGKFDMGWDRYREVVLERQKQLGVVPPNTELPPMLDGVPKWDSVSTEEKRLFARMAEVYAGFLEHADAQLGRLVEFLSSSGQLDNTLLFVFVGDNGSSGEGTLNGLYNEMSLAANVQEDPKEIIRRMDNLGQPGSYNHYPVGWSLAGDTPYRLCKQYTHFGGTRNPLVVHWPKRIQAKGEIRWQFHHVIDIVPTILEAAGVEPPKVINGMQQGLIEGVPMNYSFDDPDAPTNHPTQYFEMLGNRAIIDGKWKAVTYHGRKPWENRAAWGFDEDHWELYDIERDPAECHDLMEARDRASLEDPMVKKMIELVGLWWAEAGRYNVLPLDDRFQERLLARGGLVSRTKYTFYPGATRIPESAAPATTNRSWSVDVEIEIPDQGARGPIVVMGGDTNGWSLYLDSEGKPTFCYNLANVELTYIRGSKALASGRHVVRYEFEKRGKEPFGAGGIGRLFVGGRKVAEGEIPRTTAFGYSLDETFDVGCDKGSPVTPEYRPLASFTGKIVKVDVDLSPDFVREVVRHGEEQMKQTMLRE
ncbi:MAG TPA: arylsulfatase [Kofleriaceae bacterium]|jgi:arylsulfatase|nr:arylsulfatase [Kofleriaceae bacterium]